MNAEPELVEPELVDPPRRRFTISSLLVTLRAGGGGGTELLVVGGVSPINCCASKLETLDAGAGGGGGGAVELVLVLVNSCDRLANAESGIVGSCDADNSACVILASTEL